MGAASGESQQLLLVGGNIYTMDPDRPRAAAIAVRDGIIVGVGEPDDLGSLLGRHRVLSLRGLTLVPGLTDSHIHFAAYALQMSRLNLEGVTGLEEALTRVVAGVAGLPAEGWVQGRGWDTNIWAPGETPTCWVLDRVCPHRPAALASKDGHMVWVNSRALAMAGIHRDSADPPGGRIEKDPASGEPTGVLKETAAHLVWRCVGTPAAGQVAAALRQAMPEAHSLGLTALHTPETAIDLAGWQVLHARGEMTLRVTYLPPVAQLPDLARLGLVAGFGDPWLRMGAVKIFSDGSLTARTAAMLQPYEGSPNDGGLSTLSREELFTLVQEAVAAGWPVAVHAIGDRANRDTLDAIEAAGLPGPGLRHRIEHAQILDPGDLPRFAQLGVVASMQPIHCTADRDMADRWWGARCRFAYPFQSLCRSGAVLAFGSDAPVEDASPLRGLYAAVARKRAAEPEREAWYPGEALSVQAALRAYTSGAAWAAGEEHYRGCLRPGMAADFTVLSADPFAISQDELALLQAEATFVAGRCVHNTGALDTDLQQAVQRPI